MNTPDATTETDPAGLRCGVVHTQRVRLPLPPDGLRLENGGILPELEVAYEMVGTLSPARDNAIFICHALTGDAHVAGALDTPDGPRGWWDDMVRPGGGIDTNHYCVICANILGGCRGTTGPSSLDPRTGQPYGAAFPAITVGDIVDVHQRLIQHLGIPVLAAVVGGSFGGMQALEWAIRYPEAIRHCICIASAASLSTQALAFDIVGRHAITGDPDWQQGDYAGAGTRPDRGLALARKIGHITYLSPGMMTSKFGRDRHDNAAEADDHPFRSDFQVERYLEYQGRKFIERFDANSYLHITRAMDDYDLSARYGSLDAAFARLQARLLIVALSDDWLFPPSQSADIAHALLRAGRPVSFCRLQAPHGHDAFLVDVRHLADTVRAFLPWVGKCPPQEPDPADDAAFGPLAALLPRAARVLDVGCGDGRLLSYLRTLTGAATMGVDVELEPVIDVINRGHDAYQSDIDAGLAMIPDNAFDVAILADTIQQVHHPRLALREVVRLAHEGVVTFPNFGNWAHRLRLLVRGRMPKSGALPFEWYDTPNIHLFTLRDFLALCREEGLTVHRTLCLGQHPLSRLLIRLRWCNLGAERVIVRLSRPAAGAAPTVAGCAPPPHA